MENSEFEKAKVFIIVEVVEYVANSVAVKNIIRKTTGDITATSFDSGEILFGKASAFDTFIQIIEGQAEIEIDGKYNLLEVGQSIIIPAHKSNTIIAHVKFKMLSTVIKSGYE